ncbi:MAG: hypothetical protein M5U19_14450 [Microthrixaceae bacterium]|nr:hypothetical protein [Microthrixaceae bacterium]
MTGSWRQGPAPRVRTSSRHPLAPMHWPCSPDGEGVPAGGALELVLIG